MPSGGEIGFYVALGILVLAIVGVLVAWQMKKRTTTTTSRPIEGELPPVTPPTKILATLAPATLAPTLPKKTTFATPKKTTVATPKRTTFATPKKTTFATPETKETPRTTETTRLVETTISSTAAPGPPANGGNWIDTTATWYCGQGDPYPNMSCGRTMCGSFVAADSSCSVAMSVNEVNGNNRCGQVVEIEFKKNGARFEAPVTDGCEACASDGHIDLAAGCWHKYGMNKDDGVIPIRYRFLDKRVDYKEVTF